MNSFKSNETPYIGNIDSVIPKVNLNEDLTPALEHQPLQHPSGSTRIIISKNNESQLNSRRDT